jgi:hypothetical protein
MKSGGAGRPGSRMETQAVDDLVDRFALGAKRDPD